MYQSRMRPWRRRRVVREEAEEREREMCKRQGVTQERADGFRAEEEGARPYHKRRDESCPDLCGSNGLAEAEQQCAVAVDPLCL